MLAYAVAVGEDNSALDSGNRGWREWRLSFNENVALQKGFRLSSRWVVGKQRFEVISALLTAQGHRSNKTQTCFGDWRLTDGLKRFPPSTTSGFKVQPVLRKFFIYNFEGILTHKVLRSLSSCFFHAHSFTFMKHTPLVSFLLCDVIRNAGAFVAHVS